MLDSVHGRSSICNSGGQVARLQFPSGLLVMNGTATHTSLQPHRTSFDSIAYQYCYQERLGIVSFAGIDKLTGHRNRGMYQHGSSFINKGILTGALHAGHHTQEFWLYQNVTSQGQTPKTVEDVLRRSTATSGLHSIFANTSIRNVHYWHDEPRSGYYCTWTHRQSDPDPPYPDCLDVNTTFRRQARELLAAGVDYVATDSTNLGNIGPLSDLIQIRPEENLMRMWAAMRKGGEPTPMVAAWQVCAPGMDLWKRQLELYNDPDISPIILRSPKDPSKKVFFVPWKPGKPPKGPPDNTTVAAIEANGGRHDVTVVFMWANFGIQEYSNGLWSFFAPCLVNDTDTPSGLQYTTSVAAPDLTPCRRPLTTGSPLGTQMSVSPSYQLGHTSLPLASAGKLAGFTVKKMFASVFQSRPENIFLSDWNAFAQAGESNPYLRGQVPSQGLGMDGPFDPESGQLFSDTYGSSLSRDIAPSRGSGTLYYDIVASCIRVARLQAAGLPVLSHTTLSGPRAACSVQGEQCCEFDPAVEAWVTAWSVRARNGTDWIVTSDPYQYSLLVHAQSDAWEEVCNPFHGPTATCVNTSYAQTGAPYRLSGPFLALNWTARQEAIQERGGPIRGWPTEQPHGEQRKALTAGSQVYPEYSLINESTPLYRCVVALGLEEATSRLHFLSSAQDCEGIGVLDSPPILGGVLPNRSSLAPRRIQRCDRRDSTGNPVLFYHVLDWDACHEPGDRLSPPLGYVR